MFRQKALDRLKSPEDLDNALVIIPIRSWIILGTLCFLAVTALVWSIFGRIPITVDGFGVLINPGNVKGIQSRGAGQVTDLDVRVGQFVKEGDILARINQPDIQKDLDQQRIKHGDLVAYGRELDMVDDERFTLESHSIKEQRDFIAAEIASARSITLRVEQQYTAFDAKRRENIEKSQKLTQALNDSLAKRVKTMTALRSEGLTSEDLLLNVQSEFMNTESKLNENIVRAEELELGQVEREQTALDRKNRLADLELQLLKLNIREQQLAQEIKQGKQGRLIQIREVANTIERLELNLRQQGQIVSSYAGRILEITIAVGQVVQPGSRIGTIEIDDPQAELKNLAYMSVKGGKLIQPGAFIQVTPATVERERYGSIIGRVTKVSSFPITREGAVNVVGSAEIAQALMDQGGAIEIEAELERDPSSFSGYKWTSQGGPPLMLSAGTTTNVRVTTEERAPISYVLPILRSWVYGQKDDQRPTF